MFNKILLYLFSLPIILVLKFIPKNKSTYIIGSSLGNHFSDNSKYFYLYFHFIEKDKNKQLIWITKNKEVFLLLKEQASR